MTISLDISKADLIALVGRTLIAAGRTDEAVVFYRLATYARDVQEVMAILPDDLTVEVANGAP